MYALAEHSHTPYYYINGHWGFWETVVDMEEEDIPAFGRIMSEYYAEIAKAVSVFGIDELTKASYWRA